MIDKLKDLIAHAATKKKEFGEVLTPLWMVDEMLGKLPNEVWYDKNLKWLDPANGFGTFSIKIISRLMDTLKNVIPEDELRLNHILNNMIYAAEIQEKNVLLYLDIIKQGNVFYGDYLSDEFDKQKELWGVDKFDIIIGNPPYQEMDGGNAASSKPIYNLFTEKSIKITNKLLFITPSRWFGGGKGLDSFRELMKKSNCISLINHFDVASDIFGEEVKIKGGVSYFLYDNNYVGLCNYNDVNTNLDKYDVIIDSKYHNFLDKILNKSNVFLNSICEGRGDNVFGIATNDSRLHDKQEENDLLCYVSIIAGKQKYIDKNAIKNYNKSLTHKVITARASTKNGNGFGNIHIGYPNEVINGSYIFFKTNNEHESICLKSYMETKFANMLLGLRKSGLDIKADTCKWIPLVHLNKIWTDEMLIEYFELNENDILTFH